MDRDRLVEECGGVHGIAGHGSGLTVSKYSGRRSTWPDPVRRCKRGAQCHASALGGKLYAGTAAAHVGWWAQRM